MRASRSGVERPAGEYPRVRSTRFRRGAPSRSRRRFAANSPQAFALHLPSLSLLAAAGSPCRRAAPNAYLSSALRERHTTPPAVFRQKNSAHISLVCDDRVAMHIRRIRSGMICFALTIASLELTFLNLQ
jgi:hypothetical protein